MVQSSAGIKIDEIYRQLKQSLQMDLVAGHAGLSRKIKMTGLNRPGLALAGYDDYFASERPQVFGRVEIKYLQTLSKQEREDRIRSLFSFRIPCCIVARRLIPPKELVKVANEFKVPLFRSQMITMDFINKATLLLEDMFAPQTTITGTLMEIFGVGTLLKGNSGVGKSECALGLIEKGHRLVADDVVRVKVKDSNQLIGYGNEVTGHHMEIRGIGIINVQTLFGAGCVRNDKRIDIVMSLNEWNTGADYDRLGIDDKTCDILGIELPYVVIPVKPGRDIVLLAETAALNQRLKWLGYHAAQDFNNKLLDIMKNKRKRK